MTLWFLFQPSSDTRLALFGLDVHMATGGFCRREPCVQEHAEMQQSQSCSNPDTLEDPILASVSRQPKQSFLFFCLFVSKTAGNDTNVS